MQCVILAGGLATRMRPLTDEIPKSLIPVGDKPFAHYQLRWLKKCGVTDIVFSIGYRGEMIRDYVGDGSRWGLKACYVDEGKELRGTGGALRLALDQGVLDPNFLVVYGDSFLPIDFGEVFDVFSKSRDAALMTVFENAGKWEVSNANYKDGRILLYDKNKDAPGADQMRFVDYGLSAFRKGTIAERIPSGVKLDLAVVFRNLSLQGMLGGFEVKSRFYEIGSFSGLEDFKKWLSTASAF